MSGQLKTSILDRLEAGGREGRASHLLSRMALMIPEQIRVLREQRGWSQTKLGKEAKKPPNVVSRAEDPAYGRFTLKTLVEYASAFDVAVLVKFVPYSRYLDEFDDHSPAALHAESFTNELGDLRKRRHRKRLAGSSVKRPQAPFANDKVPLKKPSGTDAGQTLRPTRAGTGAGVSFKQTGAETPI